MRVDGEGARGVMIVCEAPGDTEDMMGRPLVGIAGTELGNILWKLGVDMRQDCWLTNACICRPISPDNKNRKPTGKEISYCRPNLLKAIETYQPDVIIPLGMPAIQSVMSYAWKDEDSEYGDDNVARWAGWRIPSTKLNAWICPSYHPSFLCKVKDKNAAANLIVTEHLRNALSCGPKPYTRPPRYEDRVHILDRPDEIIAEIEAFTRSTEPIAFDFENSPLKPDRKDSYIICCSMSDGERSIAFPWLPPVLPAFKKFIQSDVPKIAANIRHEERWCWKILGCGVRNWKWDTLLGAHWLNCAHGVCGLKFQVFVNFGVPYYASHLDALIEREGPDEGKNSHNQLKDADLRDVLIYCGLDSLFEVMVARKQMEAYEPHTCHS